MMTLNMPFLMGWMALTLASGLALYFLVSNLLSIAQSAALAQVNWKGLLPGQKPAINPEAKARKDETPSAKKDEPAKSAQFEAQHARELRAARRKKPIQQARKKRR